MRSSFWLLLLAACAPTVSQDGPLKVEDERPIGGDSGAQDSAAPEPEAAPPVVINELMASNESTLRDEAGGHPDWVELYNQGEDPVALDGWVLRDGGGEVTLPDGLQIEGGGLLLLYLDADGAGGALPMGLSRDGEVLQLLAPTAGGLVLADRMEPDALRADVSWGRFPDGGPYISGTIQATPGAPNPHDPGISLDPTDWLFPQDRVLQVNVSLPPASVEGLTAEPTVDVPAGLDIDGRGHPRVSVRIKGQWGSARELSDKPALRLNIDRYVEGQRFAGMETITLNNMVQDASYLHETIVYGMMRRAGVPAPRTAWAQVRINGEYKGIYLLIESPDDQFLQRWFDDPSGNLYEGEYGQDLTSDSYPGLDQDEEGASDSTDRAELARLAALLDQAPSEALVPQLEAIVDVDAWMKAMASEVVIGHWDGYFYYPNNYRVYHDPSADQLTLLVWGTDQTLDWWGDSYAPNGALARWMLAVPSLRARYDLALWEMAQVMSEYPYADERARCNDLIGDLIARAPFAASPADWRATLNYAGNFMRDRPAVLRAELFPDGEPSP